MDDIQFENRNHRDLLATDFTPSKAEAQSLRLAVEEQEKLLEDIESQISSLEFQLEEMRTRRNAIRDACLVKKALVAPIRTVPPEVLGEIFWSSIQDAPIIFPERASFLLTRICRRWRRIALGTPRLWTTLTIKTSPKNETSFPIQSWLSWSGSLPLDIDISRLTRRGTQIVQSIARNIHRCRKLISRSSQLELLFPPGTTTVAPLLLDFQVTDEYLRLSPTSMVGDIFAPNIEVIDIPNCQLPLTSISFNPGVLRIVRWTMRGTEGFALERLVQFLVLCPNLEKCDFREITFSHMSLSLDRVILSRLRHLSIRCDQDLELSALLAPLQVPALEYLHVGLRNPEVHAASGLATAMRSLFSYPTPTLKQLHIIRIRFSAEDLLSVLRTIPSLQTLTLEFVHLDTMVLAAMTVKPETPPNSWICPRLSWLRLNSTDIPGAAPLINMIKTRSTKLGPEEDSDHFQCLTSLSIRNCHDISPDDRVAFWELEDNCEGLWIDGNNLYFEDDDSDDFDILPESQGNIHQM